MNHILLAAASALVLAACTQGAPAKAAMNGPAMNGQAGCAGDAEALVDGCATAPMHAGFLAKSHDGFSGTWGSYARQSGRKWAGGDHPWGWFSAGIDFSVGAYTPIASLRDPATASVAGCAYEPKGSTAGGALFLCSSGAVNVAHINFSLHNGTVLEFTKAVTGVVISDCYFKNGSNTAVANGYLIKIDYGAVANLDWESSTVDGAWPAMTASLVADFVDNRSVGGSGTTTVKYIAAVNSPDRVMNGVLQSGAYLFADNYIQDFNMLDDGSHGEAFYYGGGGAARVSSVTMTDNVVLLTSAVRPGGFTTVFYHSTGKNDGAEFQSTIDQRNIVVINMSGGAAGLAGPCYPTGSIAGTTLTLSAMAGCPKALPSNDVAVTGSGVAADSVIRATLTPWNGKIGVYTLSNSSNVSGEVLTLSSSPVAGALSSLSYNRFDAFSAIDNWIDATGSKGFYHITTTGGASGPGVTSPTLTRNTNLVSAAAISAFNTHP